MENNETEIGYQFNAVPMNLMAWVFQYMLIFRFVNYATKQGKTKVTNILMSATLFDYQAINCLLCLIFLLVEEWTII